MNLTGKDVAKAREHLTHENFHQRWNFGILAQELERLASMFERTSRAQHRELMAEFHNDAGKLPYVFDDDFGALVLEVAADATADKELRVWLYTEAKFRAIWCAQAGTSGGESLARYQSVKRLDEKLQATNPA